MNFSALLTGQSFILDANILLYAWTAASAQCGLLLQRCAQSQLNGVVPLPTLAEATHRMMIVEARSLGLVNSSNPARALSGRPDLVKRLSQYRLLIGELINTGIKVEPASAEDFEQALENQERLGLLMNDALLLAVSQRLRIHSIVSADKAFAPLPGISWYEPGDLNG